MEPFASSAPGAQPPENVTYIRDGSDDETPGEYDFTPEQLMDAVRGKHYVQAMESKGFVLIAPDVRAAFPDAQAVN